MKRLLWFFLISFSCLAMEPIHLKITNGNHTKIFHYADLMKRNDLEHISVPKDPSYQNRSQTFRASRLINLFSEFNLNKDLVVQFNCTDGFSAPIDTTLLMNKSSEKSIAYLAIEDPMQKWANLPNKKLSAGPFRVIWANPEKSNIVQEQWPYMISSFEIKGTMQETYPKIFPAPSIAKDDPIKSGFKVFLNNCFACHKMNDQGSASIGPDLNIPMNPTEYFKEGSLKMLIRNPKSLRTWKTSKMPDFDESEISNADLENLIKYLQHMSLHKVKK